ncbi:ABC transporter ATP-binding protein/permease [Paenibacillus sp. N1-5-1-14]|uniref:ABC transporter ATP-binding protein n=1 Tax=Paenibacillus radicibacter TaxID=2972488 RepID=UPI002159A032|nr:ABC transporter ATP-binding protein [Paenibacillus radicibacter]MCR8642783.1 ABC transporter ATP-binding protein/permease [Paenibacillus radicibacter]
MAKAGQQTGKPSPKPKNWYRTLSRIGTYLSAYKGMLALILIMVVASSLLALLGPYLIGQAVDIFIVNKELEGLWSVIGLLIGVYILYSLSTWLQNYWMIGAAQQAIYSMRTDLFKQLHRLPVSYYTKRQHGELMSRITNDIDNVSQTLNSSFIQISSSVLTFIGMISLMLWLSPLLTLITLMIVPIMFLGMKWITNRTGKLFKEQQRNIGELNGFIEETFSGQKIVKAFSQEQKVIETFRLKNERLRTSGYWAQTYSGFIPKLMNVLNNLSFAFIAGAGALLAVRDLVSIGVIVTFCEYARQFTRPLNDLANQFNTFLSAIAGAERVFEVLDEAREEKDERQAVALTQVRGDIEFEHVSFTYEQGGNTLRDISFRAEAGQTVALVGPTGAGKTTIINLLSRFYNLNEGQIYLDGTSIQEITRQSLRQHMGFVLQDSFLFQGTIRDNIRYGRLDATDSEVEAAAQMANAHSFIMKLPNQYETVLDQDGSGISQGQKQLLSIARAMLADPSILILDEATSSIDTITEIKIQEALYRLMQGRTNIVIAHRLNTIRQADLILVLEDGRIIEQGTHQSLLEQQGFYYGMHNNQVRIEAKHTIG